MSEPELSADTVRAVVPAWDLIGHEGKFRLVGGRRIYEGVMHNLATARSNRVRLAYLVADESGLRQINRYVDPDTPIEVIEDYDADPHQPRTCWTDAPLAEAVTELVERVGVEKTAWLCGEEDPQHNDGPGGGE